MDFTKVTDGYTLSNGILIPCIGYGTFRMPSGEDTTNAIVAAVQAGFRHIDTAQGYGNEDSVGQALKKCGIPRSEIFITSKLANSDHGYKETHNAFAQTLKNLDTDYLDLYLIHWPAPLACRERWQEANAESWKAIEELYEAGKIRAIGVSNFWAHHVEELKKTAKILPMVNQISLSPGVTQQKVCDYSRKQGMILEAYSPLGQGRALASPEIAQLSARYHKTPAQICIRWSLQMGFLPLPKSTNPDRIAQNMDVFGFSLTPEDVAMLAVLDCGSEARNPDTVQI